MPAQQNPTQQHIHPLLQREVWSITSWKQFLEYWSATQTMEQMVGLLHVGLAIPYTDQDCGIRDRIVFYLQIADSWEFGDILIGPNESTDREYTYGIDEDCQLLKASRCDLRKMVAKKAFSILCSHCFKLELGVNADDRRYLFGFGWYDAFSAKIFPALMDFFRITRGNWKNSRIGNIPILETHQKKVTERFLGNMFKYACRRVEEIETRTLRTGFCGKDEVVEKERLEAAKAPLVERLLWVDGGVAILEEYLLKLNEQCLKVLKEEALRAELTEWDGHPVRSRRPVASIEEACYVGSPAAQLLKLYKIKKGEYDRLTSIIAAEDEVEAAKKRLKELAN